MVGIEDLYRNYRALRPLDDPDQLTAVERPANAALFVVAGPGTGKTTCLVLRILKLVLVDALPPRSILATTFTKKAAAELRSRILSWGFRIIEALVKDSSIPAAIRRKIAAVDINQVITGTIDSICDQLLREHRDPGTQPPILADDNVAKTLLVREGLLATGLYQDQALDGFLLNCAGGSTWGWHLGRKNEVAQTIWDRCYQDQLDWPSFISAGSTQERSVRQALDAVLSAYAQALGSRNMVDFAQLEQAVLDRLRAGELKDFLSQVRVILVDEYQDTNLLQESIYFEMAKACGGALTVVGDDDQSLYRFRGATVELFRDFDLRYQAAFGRQPSKIFLKTNHRSTKTIVSLVSDYAALDADYQAVRVVGKPSLAVGPKGAGGLPILGMFRTDVTTLASDLATLVHDVFRGKGFEIPGGHVIEKAASAGDLGDCALLCSSPAEYAASGDPRLPRLLRDELRNQLRPIEVFNPRGQDLTEIHFVVHFGGLLLECLDPEARIEGTTSGMSPDTIATFQSWRVQAIAFAQSARVPAGLVDYARGWAKRDPGRTNWVWPRSVPVLDLVYGLVHFFPELHDDPEGQVYLEVFTRQVSACEQVGRFKGRVVTDPSNQDLSDASVKELLRDFLGPIAGGVIKVNEELVETFPRDRLCVLSIHQAKGLEFPLTIVDVGSDFRTNHRAHAFKRFPNDGGSPHILEDLMRPFTSLGAPTRSARDRAFDDLYRQFFVSFSRAQDVLLLVGLTKTLPGGQVPNVATGWDRDGNCAWAGNPPFLPI